MSTQVAYRLGDGAPVTMDAARAIWTAVAREVLEETSSTSPIVRSELARQVQQRSGVYTRMPATDWLPAVLADLDPDLVARLRVDAPPAAPRAKTTRAPRVRKEPVTRKREERPAAICPTCFTQLPVSGRCDTCG